MTNRLLAGLLLASVTTAAIAQTQATIPTVPLTDGKAQLGDFGVDLTGMDKSIKPGDDFYRFVNGAWQDRTQIPPDRPSYGSFAILRDLTDQRTRLVIEDAARNPGAPGSINHKIGTIYASFMDEAAIETKGVTPLKPYLARINAVRTATQLAATFAAFGRRGIGTPIGISVDQDLKDNSRYSVYLAQGSLGLPDRDYYLLPDAKFDVWRAKYVAHIATMLRLGDWPDPDAAAERIFDLEKKIATVQWTRAEKRQVDKRYNPEAANRLDKTMPGFDWISYLKAAGFGACPEVVVSQPSALASIAKIIAGTPITTWRDYLAFRQISKTAPLLSKPFVDANFAFYGTTLNDTPRMRDRWKRGINLVNSGLGDAVGQIYVQRYFPPAAKAKADELVKNLIAAFDIRLQKLQWMAPETKAKARAKLGAFTAKIGYPDRWRDYTALRVVPGDVLGNADRAAEFEYERQVAKIGKPVDRSEWFMTPQTVSAYANPPMNEIVFPAAILQPPFFDPNADPAVNYGAIGVVIGHEISHHFDDQGRKFDPNGNLVEWWTPQDAQRFKAYTDKVVAQYAAYQPIAGTHVNGELTLGENMADLAGVNVAYDAYKMSLRGKSAPVIDGYTGDQRFFMGFSQTWRSKSREATMRQDLLTDPHTPDTWRPYVVRNLDAWYTAFDVKPGEKFYLAPTDRIKVW